jgi:hypothetical protein
VLLACPRLYNIIVWPSLIPAYDPHMGYNPAIDHSWIEQDWKPELPRKAINRTYADGHGRFVNSTCND